MPITFQTARREKVKARVAIDGPAGAGKTWTALTCATALAKGGKIAVIDTERGSARLYADTFSFDVLELPQDDRMFSPEVYVDAIKAAEKTGYAAIVIDSLSHAWEGEGGALAQVDEAAAKIRGNSYAAWRNVTPMHNKLVGMMLQSPCHIIATMRSKMDYAQIEENGRKTIKKLGMAPIQRQGMEYEFTIVCDMDVDHRLIVTKSRCAGLADKQAVKPTVDFFTQLADWLDSGDAPAPKPEFPAPETTQQPTIKPTWTLANLIKEAQKRYGVTEQEVRDTLKAAGFTTFKAEQYIAALTALDTAFVDKKPKTEEVEPEYLKQPKEVEA